MRQYISREVSRYQELRQNSQETEPSYCAEPPNLNI